MKENSNAISREPLPGKEKKNLEKSYNGENHRGMMREWKRVWGVFRKVTIPRGRKKIGKGFGS